MAGRIDGVIKLEYDYEEGDYRAVTYPPVKEEIYTESKDKHQAELPQAGSTPCMSS